MENMDKGLTDRCTKMGAESLTENTPNAPEFICPICLPNPKSSGFQWKKASLGVRSPCSCILRERKTSIWRCFSNTDVSKLHSFLETNS